MKAEAAVKAESQSETNRLFVFRVNDCLALRTHRGRKYVCSKCLTSFFGQKILIPEKILDLYTINNDPQETLHFTAQPSFRMIYGNSQLRIQKGVRLGGRGNFLIALVSIIITIQVLFLADLSYLNGALYHEAERVHNLKVLMVDYDHGSIGQSLRSASDELQADTFPSVTEYSMIEYPDLAHITDAILVGKFWAAIYAHPEASSRLAAALRSDNTTMRYNASDTLTYMYNGARYTSTIQGYIEPNMRTLVSKTQAMYQKNYGLQDLQIARQSTNAASALLCPIGSTVLDIKKTEQGARTVYNTIGMVYPILMQFFFVLALNIFYGQNRLFMRWSPVNNYLFRTGVALSATFIGAICASALIFAFQDGWGLSNSQYFIAVLVFWLYMHVDFLYTDVVTAFVPIKFVPFFIFSFVIFNVTSLLVPFELSPGFYRIGYVAPAHEAYRILIQIWSGGPYRLYQALPILFAWEILLTPLAIFGMHRRCQATAGTTMAAQPEVKDMVERQA